MAKMQISGPEGLLMELERLEADVDEIAEEALQKGAGIVANEIRRRLNALPSDTFRYLQDGDKFTGISDEQRQDLNDGLGISPVGRDNNLDYDVKVGFEGYGSFPTRKYPKGLPNPMLARAIESGSSVRDKHPFVAPSVTKTKKAALAAMQEVIDDHLKNLT